MKTIAALFVETNGVYFGLPDVDPWDEARDARSYEGPHAVVAHPPCERWGRFSESAFGRPLGKKRGDDGGCFASALASVRRWGGLLEHPEASYAWRHHQLIVPLRGGGWSVADDQGGWTCCIEQGWYGHRTPKATWLYARGVEIPSLRWGRSSPEWFTSHHSAGDAFLYLPRKRRAETPIAFRDLLLEIARTARHPS